MLNVQNQAETAVNFMRFIGLANLSVIAINPTKAEFKQLFNRELEQEPNYLDPQHGRKVVFYLKGEGNALLKDGSKAVKEINATHTVFLKNEIEMNKAGNKKVYTDNFGNAVFMSEEEKNAQKFKMDYASLRLAYRGESDLLNFMKAYAAPAKEQQFFIPDIAQIIATGNVTTLRHAIASANKYGNTIRALLGIRTSAANGKQYQTIYKKKIDRGTSNTLEYLWKNMRDNKDYIKEYFGDFNFASEYPDPRAFTLREYYQGMEGSMAASAAPAAVQNFNSVFGSINSLPMDTPGLPGHGAMPHSAMSQPANMMPQSSGMGFPGDEADDDLPF